MYEPDDLRALVDAEGFHGVFAATRWFVYGSAVRRPSPLTADALLHDPGSVPAAVPGEE
jgi:hypothetical protein